MENLGWMEWMTGLIVGGGISFVANRYLKYGFLYYLSILLMVPIAIGGMFGWDLLVQYL